MFENLVCKKIFGFKKSCLEYYIVRNFMIYTGQIISLKWLNIGRYNDLGMCLEWRQEVMQIEIASGILLKNINFLK
jgi:hypothetical protein